ncbi:MATH and LRR domain-containing protein PFE0570w isoform X1 [Spatholobus suberectus]|nr:MATH and LRR domain-containing protein PFE0570w isoform X1 [Spatholobus suberectus]
MGVCNRPVTVIGTEDTEKLFEGLLVRNEVINMYDHSLVVQLDVHIFILILGLWQGIPSSIIPERSLLKELNQLEEVELKWGKKRSIGGKRKDMQLYESFIYEGKEYMLYNAVYLHNRSRAKPYIGKLIKIQENGYKSRKMKVQYFFAA